MAPEWMDEQQARWFSRGYDRGNYGNAYESTDWESWYAAQCDKIPESVDRDIYRDGMLLGFFGSYEIHEIADSELAFEVARVRQEYGED